MKDSPIVLFRGPRQCGKTTLDSSPTSLIGDLVYMVGNDSLGQDYNRRNASCAALMVCSMSAAMWAVETKAASNWEGAK